MFQLRCGELLWPGEKYIAWQIGLLGEVEIGL